MRRPRLGIYGCAAVGGVARYVKLLEEGIRATEYDCVKLLHHTERASESGDDSVGAVGNATTTWRGRWRRLMLRLWRITPGTWHLAAGLIAETLQLARTFRSNHVDVLHTNFTGFEVSAIAAKLGGVRRVVGTYHILPSEQYTTARWLQWIIENLSARCVDVPIAVSRGAQRAWEERCPTLRGRFRLIYHGLDAERVEEESLPAIERRDLGVSSEDTLLAVVARLAPMKGIAVLLEAMPAILARQPKTMLLLIGDGPVRPDLERIVRETGLSERVRFLGWRTDVLRIVRTCDIVVLPSVNLETFGYALAEAMLLEKPTVATDVGGMPELVEHGVTGYIVPRRDPAALASAIVDLIGNPDKAREFGRRGRARVREKFPLERMVEKTLGMYKRTMDDGAA